MWSITIMLFISVYSAGVLAENPTRLGPVFSLEPPGVVRYARTAGAQVTCVARGAASTAAPTVTWLTDDGTPLADLPRIRRVHANGTLELLPSRGETVEPNHKPAVVRCRASNAYGTLLSRDVHLIPVTDDSWEVTVVATVATEGGVGALTCRVTGAPARPALWYRADTVIGLDTPSPESRYLRAGDTLLVRDVSAADMGPYSCAARHELTAITRRSRPVALAVSPGPASGTAPRLLAAGAFSTVDGAPVCLPCAAGQYPPPHYTWYRESDGRLRPVEDSRDVWRWAGGAALCLRSASREHAGAWLCKAYDVFGDASAQTRLEVQAELTVTLRPEIVVVVAGSTVRLNCSANSRVAELHWLHDGAVLTGARGDTLVLPSVAHVHRGTYQCVAREGLLSAQAAAEIRLGDSPPELQYTFIEQALRAGAAVTLRCAAVASPPAALLWLLDDQPLDRYIGRHRYSVREERSQAGETVSVLSIPAALPADGGRYSCRAANALGAITHSARLNIYGPPVVRAVGAVRAVAGQNLSLLCPYAGYPISSVRWARRGATAIGDGGRISARGAALRLAPALPQDAGHYTCSVTAPPAHLAAGDFEIQVRNPPKISPFMFSPELTEGSSVQVLCGVSSGDKPIYFSWLKDGAALPPDLQIEEKSLNEFSLLMFPKLRATHSGRYTCRVSNHAATANYTALLTVKVAPSWLSEPQDCAAALGASLRLECAAGGHPAPLLSWHKRIEDDSSGPEGAERWEPPDAAWERSEATGRATLSARAASRSHAGLYRCNADNGVGPPLTKRVSISVHEPANFGTSSEVARNVSSVRGQSATLVCAARGDTPLTVHWSRRGSRLEADTYRWTIIEVRGAGAVRSELRFRAAERTDAGEYRCHAVNQYGRSDLVLFLHVEEPPDAPHALQIWGIGGDWARVRWRACLAPNTRFVALYTPMHARHAADLAGIAYNLTIEVDDHEINNKCTLSALLKRLRPAEDYSVRLSAHNRVGRSPLSEPLRFTTLEETPSSAPQHVRVRSIDSGELLVAWTVLGQDSWNGELLGYVVTWRECDPTDATENPERVGRSVTRGGTSSELTLGGLRRHQRHEIIVRAFNRAGPGPPSASAYAVPSDSLISEAPALVTCEALSSGALRVRWTPPAFSRLPLEYDVLYAPMYFSQSWSGGVRTARARAAEGDRPAAVLSGLRAAVNYSVTVRGRSATGAGPPSAPVYCTTTEDVPGPPEVIRAVATSAQAVRVTWAPPRPELRAGRITHYTLHTRELGKVGGEWSQRVEAGGITAESWHAPERSYEVRGLRERAVYEFWVRAATAAGAGTPSRAVTAAPTHTVSARITSVGRAVRAPLGTRVRLACAALGAPPLLRYWTPLPPHHTITDTGDLIIHELDEKWSRNYTCSVRNGAGGDTLQHALQLARAPAAPTLRLARASRHKLHIIWEPPHEGGAPLLGYTLLWSGGWDSSGASHTVPVPAGEVGWELRGLFCGAPYSVSVRAHNAVGASPASPTLQLRTRGDKAKAPSGKESIWSNSSALRVSLLAWGGRCPVVHWRVAFRLATPQPPAWTDLVTDGEMLHLTNLEPATWYEIRIMAQSPAGETVAVYRAATRAHSGEKVGEPIDLPAEARSSPAEGVGRGGGAVLGEWRRAGALAALGGSALAVMLAAALLLVYARRHRSSPPQYTPQLPQNGKTIDPPDSSDQHEISPYATFSMSSGVCESVTGASSARSCALHLRSFAREPLELTAAPPRPQLLAHPNDYGSARETDSESSGSPCAACAAELYRLPAAHLSETLPAGGGSSGTAAAESSADDGSYGSARRPPRARRRDPTRARLQPALRSVPPALGGGP